MRQYKLLLNKQKMCILTSIVYNQLNSTMKIRTYDSIISKLKEKNMQNFIYIIVSCNQQVKIYIINRNLKIYDYQEKDEIYGE